MITRQHILAGITTVCLSLPALTPYFFLPTGKVQVSVIAVLSVINAAASFASCSLADSIAVASVGAASSSLPSRIAIIFVFIVGAVLCVLAPSIIGVGRTTPIGILFCLANLVIAVSEGIAKASGKFRNHQLGLIASGMLFPLPFLLISPQNVDGYVFSFSVVRIVTVGLVFCFILNIGQIRKAWQILENGWPHMDRLTQLSILGFGYAFLERVAISTVSLLFDAAAGKFFLAVYQSLGILTGVRSQLVNSRFHLIRNDSLAFVKSTTKALRPLLILTPLLAVVGATILTKAGTSLRDFSLILTLSIGLIIAANVVDLLAATYGVLLTFTGRIAKNVKCELLAIALVACIWGLGQNVALVAAVLLVVRMSQLYIKRKAVQGLV